MKGFGFLKNVLTNNEYMLLQKILNLSQAQLATTLNKILKQTYDENAVTFSADGIIVKGSIPIALVAHLDTVFAYEEKELVYDRERNVIWSPDGAGFDDRAGIYAIIALLRKGYRPWIILCADEETGGIGASNIARSMDAPAIRYMIELDRRGSNDCVFYGDDNEEFIEYVQTFGFKEAWGTFSDISELAPTWKINAVNLSIGYQDEHTHAERLYVQAMNTTIKRVAQMLDDWENAPTSPYIAYKSFGFWNRTGLTDYDDYYDDYDYGYGSTTPKRVSYNGQSLVFCQFCKNWFPELETIPYLTENGELLNCCGECIKDNIEWCQSCNDPHTIEELNKSPYHFCSLCDQLTREDEKSNG